MSTPAAARDRSDHAVGNAIGGAALVLYAVGVVLLALFALTPDLADDGTLLAAFRNPGAWGVLLIQAALAVAAFVAFWWPRRREKLSFALFTVAGLGISTLVLGLAVYWNHTVGQAAVFTPISRTVGLFAGSVTDIPGTTETPLALQAARLTAQLSVLVGASSALALLFRDQIDRLSTRFARSLIVLVGLDEQVMPILRRLRAEHSRAVTVVLVEDANRSQMSAARDLGARVVRVNFTRPRTLGLLLLRHQTTKVQVAYLLSADATQNIGRLRIIQGLAQRQADSSLPSPRANVRIEDPWQAEHWRRSQIGQGHWLVDALSSNEITARILVDRVVALAADRVAIVGHSPLALALAAEVARRRREALALSAAENMPALVFVGPQAGRLEKDHLLMQARFGTAGASSIAIDLRDPAADPDVLADILSGTTQPAVILAADGLDISGSNLAARHPSWTVLQWDGAVHGLTAEPIMDNFDVFGLTLEPPENAGIDVWERLGRLNHERYRQESRDEPTPATLTPWSALDEFYRETNVRQVVVALRSAVAIGRTWTPLGGDGGRAAASPPTAAEFEQMAALEHASWRANHERRGWTVGDRSDELKRHPNLVDWSALDATTQGYSVASLRAVFALLSALGYQSVRR